MTRSTLLIMALFVDGGPRLARAWLLPAGVARLDDSPSLAVAAAVAGDDPDVQVEIGVLEPAQLSARHAVGDLELAQRLAAGDECRSAPDNSIRARRPAGT